MPKIASLIQCSKLHECRPKQKIGNTTVPCREKTLVGCDPGGIETERPPCSKDKIDAITCQSPSSFPSEEVEILILQLLINFPCYYFILNQVCHRWRSSHLLQILSRALLSGDQGDYSSSSEACQNHQKLNSFTPFPSFTA